MDYSWRVKSKDSGSSGSEPPSRNASVDGAANGNGSVANGRKPPAGSMRGTSLLATVLWPRGALACTKMKQWSLASSHSCHLSYHVVLAHGHVVLGSKPVHLDRSNFILKRAVSASHAAVCSVNNNHTLWTACGRTHACAPDASPLGRTSLLQDLKLCVLILGSRAQRQQQHSGQRAGGLGQHRRPDASLPLPQQLPGANNSHALSDLLFTCPPRLSS